MGRKRGRVGRRPWGVEQERLHPRDDRGRFAKKGGQKWAGRVLAGYAAGFGDLSMHDPKHAIRTGDGFFDPTGGPRSGRGPGGLIDTKRVRDNAEVAASVRAYSAGERSRPLSEVRNGDQVKVDGEWREVWSVGSSNGVRTIGWHDRKGIRFGEIREDEQSYVDSRPYTNTFEGRSGRLTAGQRKDMEGWRADAAKPAPFILPTSADTEREFWQGRVDEAQRAYDAAFKKVRLAALKNYPLRDGYTRRDRDRYSRQDAESATYSEKWQLENAQESYRTHAENVYKGDEVDPRAWPKLQGDLDRDRPLAVYGDLLHAHDSSHASHRALEDLSGIPAEVHAVVAAQAARTRAYRPTLEHAHLKPGEAGVFVGSVPVSELGGLDDLKGKKPRGWDEGDTYEMVDGVFRSDTFTIAVGHTANAEGHGHSAAEHELGHALDVAIASRRLAMKGHWDPNPRESRSAQWQELHRRTVTDAGDRLSPYYRQEGYAGAQEMWAEAFAEWAKTYYRLTRRIQAGQGSDVDKNPDYAAQRTGRSLAHRFGIWDEQLLKDIHEYFLDVNRFAEEYHR